MVLMRRRADKFSIRFPRGTGGVTTTTAGLIVSVSRARASVSRLARLVDGPISLGVLISYAGFKFRTRRPAFSSSTLFSRRISHSMRPDSLPS